MNRTDPADGRDAVEVAELRATLEALYAAESAMDVEASLAFWAAGGAAHFPGAPPVRGRSALRALYETFFSGLRTLESTAVHLVMARSGDLAYEVGATRMTHAGNGADRVHGGKYVAVWRRVDDAWLVAAVSFTDDASPTGEDGGGGVP